MNKTVDQIKIVEYEPSYAAAVAEMWNKSQDGWGGGNTVQTEEQVLKQEANSTNLHLYLALDGENVVGYCGLSEYREDEGALYIPLLNVRNDYHGRKIGKQLVLKALERVIELKWPRLDLYTWPGNTKAVPLYKKCGFFWEERDDSTHLMNFMPTVLNTEAVEEFFKDLNWYEASTRPIEIKPDGRIENEFHYYEYSWNNRGQELKMEFERFGRGIRTIETEDYRISATVEDFKLVFGSEYKVRYDIKNKSGKPLTISLLGIDNKNVHFSFEKDYMKIEDQESIEATFLVDPIEEEQSIWRTHPTVDTKVLINGKEAFFKVGLLPKFPANVSCHIPDNISYVGSTSTLYVDIENNYKEPVKFSFTLPESELLQLEQNEIEVTLQPKTRCSVPIQYTLKQHGFYSHKIEITATKTDNSKITFTKKIGVGFKGFGARFHGESEEAYQIYNGQYHMWLQKHDNWMVPGYERTKDQQSAFMYPKLGKPFSEEFSKLKVAQMEFFEEAGSIGYRATYKSNTFPGIQLHRIAILYAEGLIEHHCEVENTQANDFEEELWLNIPVYHTLDCAVLPYENKLVEMKDSIGSFHEYWNGSRVTENWIFSRHENAPRGLCWSENEKINFDGWFVYFENRIGKLKGKESVRTKPIHLSIGAFQTWQSFRSFATQKDVENTPKTDHLEFALNDHNPFVSENRIDIQVTDYKTSYLNGTIEIRSGEDIIDRASIRSEETMKTKEFEVNIDLMKNIGVLSSCMKLDSIETLKDALYVKKRKDRIRFQSFEKDGMESFTCRNDLLEISVAPDFYPGLYSLKAKGREWLDSSYPEVKPKSWWNPWAGGVQNRLRDVSPNSLLKEKRHVEFASLNDTKGNKWEGLKVVVRLDQHEKYKGFEFHQYFLLLPGTPFVCQTTEIIQKAGRFIDMKNWDMDCYFNPSIDLRHSWSSFQNTNGHWQKIYGGKGEQQVMLTQNVVFGSDEHDDFLQVITDLDEVRMGAYINKEVMFLELNSKLNMEDGKRYFTKPVFFMVNDQHIPETALDDLKSIRFGK